MDKTSRVRVYDGNWQWFLRGLGDCGELSEIGSEPMSPDLNYWSVQAAAPASSSSDQIHVQEAGLHYIPGIIHGFVCSQVHSEESKIQDAIEKENRDLAEAAQESAEAERREFQAFMNGAKQKGLEDFWGGLILGVLVGSALCVIWSWHH